MTAAAHGTLTKYQYDRCRCQDCRTVKAEQTRRLAGDPDRANVLRNFGPGFQPEDDDSWRTQAACVGLDHLFFLELHQGNSRPAKAICAVCPVRQTCLDYAVDTHAYFGIWGGDDREGTQKVCDQEKERGVMNLVPGMKVKRLRWLPDNHNWPYWIHTPWQVSVCFLFGHQPIHDHCFIPDHDLCAWCGKSMPGMAS